MSGLRDANERTERTLEAIGMTPRRDAPAGVLTYAEQRALEIGITIAGDPQVILLDEPTAGMSRAEADNAVALIRTVSQGRTLVMVEHDMGVVFDLADRISVLVYGEIIATDVPSRIRANDDRARAPISEARAMLDVEDLHAYYGKSHILQGVSFRVDEGEIVSLLGRNGAGRSTTIRTIMGQVRPVGAIRFKGMRIDGLKPHEIARRGLGYVPEDREIFPGLTVRENLLLGMKSARQRGRWSLDEMFALFPLLRERADASGEVLVGRRAADADDLPYAHGGPRLDHDRRAHGGPRADACRSGAGTAGAHRAARCRDPVDRAEAHDRAGDFASTLCHGPRPHRVRRLAEAIARQRRRCARSGSKYEETCHERKTVVRPHAAGRRW